jgi:transposase
MRAKDGEAISPERRTPSCRKQLRRFIAEARKRHNLDEWRRGRAVLGYIQGRTVIHLSVELEVTRGSVNRWLQWYEAMGLDGLRSVKASGPAPKLTEAQQDAVGAWIDAGPQAAGYTSGVWTGPMIGDLIWQRFHVRYHNHHIPRMLNQLGFSIQRPRKRLARADAEAQATWMRDRFPAIKKKPRRVEGS